MAAVTRLVTLVDLREEVADASQMSVTARHEAVLTDGRRLLLLDDRGWSESALRALWDGEVPDGDPCRGEPDIWAVTSAEDIEETARVVVGPDEPPDGYSQEDMEAGHWAYLAGLLRQQGVAVDATELTRLPHDIVLSERLLARVGRAQGGAASS